jgi:molecular chaperone DnaK
MTHTIDFGIDLGTTNSCIARWESGAVKVFQNNSQMNVTPSVVHIMKTGRVIVGRRGSAALLTDPENVAIEFKRWMGQKDRKLFPASQRELSAEELSAEILKSLKEDVRRQTGSDVSTAVITVPAAFGALQCEATARAATLAGFDEAPLLQEPIAAAIGYGAQPGTADQKWLVFDLGGGTLDIAVVSTKNGRLTILEHRGNNLLGGKDIDRSIVDQILLPTLESTYDLRRLGPGSSRNTILPQLRVKAEEAKIDLSMENQVTISLFDVGSDDQGTPIELEMSLSRQQLQAIMEPLLDKCFVLAEEALSGARLSGKDLDRILLVGGPTQSPLLRKQLGERLGSPVDHSGDPMTIVGCGAAVYASTLEKSKKIPVRAASPSSNLVRIALAFDPVSSDLQTTVAGRILDPAPDIEIKIDAESGIWTSGWIRPENAIFETPVSLKEADITTFWVYLRDKEGRLVESDTPEFKIRHGLIPSAPPLPHTLSVEVVNPGGAPTLDAIFPKGTPLPAEKSVRYRATHSLVPGNSSSDLAIKIWEGEFSKDPDANEWVGNIVLSNSRVRRSVPEGSEIELTIKIDASRLISVEAFISSLNQHFSDRLFLPQREEKDFASLSEKVTSESAAYQKRLDEIELKNTDVDDVSTQAEISALRTEIEALKAKATSTRGDPKKEDPDDARRTVEDAKTIRGRLGRLERSNPSSGGSRESAQALTSIDGADKTILQFGSALEKQQLTLFQRELERAVQKGDGKAVERVCTEIRSLRWRAVSKHDWYWREVLESLSQPHAKFINQGAAAKLIAKGKSAVTNGDGEGLRIVVRALWDLQPKAEAEITRERAVQSGLRRY